MYKTMKLQELADNCGVLIEETIAGNEEAFESLVYLYENGYSNDLLDEAWKDFFPRSNILHPIKGIKNFIDGTKSNYHKWRAGRLKKRLGKLVDDYNEAKKLGGDTGTLRKLRATFKKKGGDKLSHHLDKYRHARLNIIRRNNGLDTKDDYDYQPGKKPMDYGGNKFRSMAKKIGLGRKKKSVKTQPAQQQTQAPQQNPPQTPQSPTSGKQPKNNTPQKPSAVSKADIDERRSGIDKANELAVRRNDRWNAINPNKSGPSNRDAIRDGKKEWENSAKTGSDTDMKKYEQQMSTARDNIAKEYKSEKDAKNGGHWTSRLARGMNPRATKSLEQKRSDIETNLSGKSSTEHFKAIKDMLKKIKQLKEKK